MAAFTTTTALLLLSPAGETHYLGKKNLFRTFPTVTQRRGISIALFLLQVSYLLIIVRAINS